MNPLDLAHKLVSLASDFQAEDILLLDITEIFPFADYFVIASATSPRQFEALAAAINHISNGARARCEGTAQAGWQLFDYGNVIVHIFGRSEREYYDLESLWSTGTQLIRIE